MNARVKLFLGVGAFSALVLGFGSLQHLRSSDPSDAPASSDDQNDVSAPPGSSDKPTYTPLARTESARIAKGSTVSQTLKNLGLSQPLIVQLTTTAKDLKNLAHMPAGTQVDVIYPTKDAVTPSQVTFKLNATQTLVLEVSSAPDAEDEWKASIAEATVDHSLISYTGVVSSSLWDSAEAAGMDPQLIHKLAEVFAWQIDFNREVQLDDRWRLSLEKLSVKGKTIGYGDIIAAEYENSGVVYTAVRYEVPGSSPQYFSPDGNSTRRMFLKSPLKFGRITSGFSANRFHPILGINRAHKGIDYGAPTGTPIMAVGDGTVTDAGYRGPSGNAVTIRHNATYSTNYKHMSKFAAGIKSGSRITMGQVIGYVGSTGLATGPHLHFEFWEGGRFVDPQGMRFPAADPVPAKYHDQFQQNLEKSLAMLPPWSRVLLSASKPKRRGAKDDLKASTVLLPNGQSTVPTE